MLIAFDAEDVTRELWRSHARTLAILTPRTLPIDADA
jgi:hypothetical protein